MTFYFRLLGGGLILLCALMVGREYSSYIARRIEQHGGFIALAGHAESKIGEFLSSGRELWLEFNNSALEEVGLLPLLKEGEGACSAYSKIEKRLALSDDTKKKLSTFFNEFGSGYRDRELSRASALKKELEISLIADKEELEKNAKVLNALLVGGGVGLIILLL